MSTVPPSPTEGLSRETERLLADLVDAARRCFADDLRSVVLFGSGAEGRLRATSDLNLMFVLRRFEQNQVDAFREPLRIARIAGRVPGLPRVSVATRVRRLPGGGSRSGVRPTPRPRSALLLR